MAQTRQQAIEELLVSLQQGKISVNQAQDSIKNASVTQQEIDSAKSAILARSSSDQPRPSNPVKIDDTVQSADYTASLDQDLILAGEVIAPAISAIVGVEILFLPQKSISSYAVHLLRFQAKSRGNLGKIESDSALAALRGAVSLPQGSACEVKPSDVIGEPGYIDVTIPRKDRQIIRFSQKEIGFRNCAGKRPELALGRDVYGKLVFLLKVIHMAVVSESGGGKSNFLHQMVSVCSLWNPPTHLQFAFIDLERRTFARFDNWPWNFCAPLVDADQEKWTAFVTKIMTEYNRRSKLFQNCEDILIWNAENPDQPQPIIMIMIEELGRLNTAFGREEVDRFLTDISERGRANGFYLTIAMQRMSQDSGKGIIDPRVANNLQTIVAFRCSRLAAGLISCPAAVNLRGNGDGLALIEGTWTRFQAWDLGGSKQGIFDGLEQWARKKYGLLCYSKPPDPVILVAQDPWDPEDLEEPSLTPSTQQNSLKDQEIYQLVQFMKSKKESQSAIVRAVFPDSKDKPLNGNTLASYVRRIDEIVQRVGGT